MEHLNPGSRDETAFSVDRSTGGTLADAATQAKATEAMQALAAGHIDEDQYNSTVSGEATLEDHDVSEDQISANARGVPHVVPEDEAAASGDGSGAAEPAPDSGGPAAS